MRYQFVVDSGKKVRQVATFGSLRETERFAQDYIREYSPGNMIYIQDLHTLESKYTDDSGET